MARRLIDPKELRMGIEVEMEHTDDPEESRKIALDHLREDPRYYSKLKDAGLADELQKAKAFPVGTVRKRKDGEYIKRDDGTWVPHKKGGQNLLKLSPSIKIKDKTVQKVQEHNLNPSGKDFLLLVGDKFIRVDRNEVRHTFVHRGVLYGAAPVLGGLKPPFRGSTNKMSPINYKIVNLNSGVGIGLSDSWENYDEAVVKGRLQVMLNRNNIGIETAVDKFFDKNKARITDEKPVKDFAVRELRYDQQLAKDYRDYLYAKDLDLGKWRRFEGEIADSQMDFWLKDGQFLERRGYILSEVMAFGEDMVVADALVHEAALDYMQRKVGASVDRDSVDRFMEAMNLELSDLVAYDTEDLEGKWDMWKEGALESSVSSTDSESDYDILRSSTDSESDYDIRDLGMRFGENVVQEELDVEDVSRYYVPKNLQRIAEIMSSGSLEELAAISQQGHTSQAFLTRINLDGDTTVGVFKPVEGSDSAGRDDMDDEDLANHEVGAFVLDKQLGFGLVPPTVMRTFGEDGSLQAYVHDSFFIGPIDLVNSKEVFRGAIFDFLVQNTDRRNGNLLYTKDDAGEYHMHFIDNGLAFSEAKVDRFLSVAFEEARYRVLYQEEELPESVVNAVRKIANETEWEPIRESLSPYLTDRQLDGIHLRAKYVLEEGGFPMREKMTVDDVQLFFRERNRGKL